MNRREFLKQTSIAGVASGILLPAAFSKASEGETSWISPSQSKDWLARWEKNILGDSQSSRPCDKEMGEELGWLVSPYLDGFHQGYRVTHDPKWVAMLMDWADACLRRSVKEPDGFIGWPKLTTDHAQGKDFYADSLLGEAMLLRPIVLMAGEILKTPTLLEKWDAKARDWLEFAGMIFQKWDARGCWREVKDGGLWVVPPFGIDKKAGQWTDDYAQRATAGFSHPANKQNHIARWQLAMHDVAKKPAYLERAEKWFRLMKSRMRTQEHGKYFVWNYWDPAGPWDYQRGSTRHWVGVHPNGEYYAIDVEGIAAAFEHSLVFTRDDIDRLVATNRDFMWNQKLPGVKFRRIDGGGSDLRWKNTPGMLWTPLVQYDETLRKIFVATNDPGGWGGMAPTPWFLALAARTG
jgi:hypothetical protein